MQWSGQVKVLVTGNAGFIGFHTASRLLQRGNSVVGIDSVNSYYDPALKRARLKVLKQLATETGADYTFLQADIADAEAVRSCFRKHQFDRVIHLAAQAGVRHSLKDPDAYVRSNLIGFLNILEACRAECTPHLTYASTSSVYGANRAMPFSENADVGHPLQFYAATKRANELMAHSYSHLFNIPATGLRFFTVYGPWGRPDMALFLFTRNIIENKPIQVFNYGRHSRDFTYIDDVVDGVIAASDQIAEPNLNWDPLHPDPATSSAPFRIYNVGNSSPVNLAEYISAIEQAVGRKAIIEYLPLQPGDVPDTYADVSALNSATGYQPKTSVTDGVARFVSWYRDYFSV